MTATEKPTEREAALLVHIAELERALAGYVLRYGNTDEVRRLLVGEPQRAPMVKSH